MPSPHRSTTIINSSHYQHGASNPEVAELQVLSAAQQLDISPAGRPSEHQHETKQLSLNLQNEESTDSKPVWLRSNTGSTDSENKDAKQYS